MRLLYPQHVHQPDDILTHQVPGLDHQGTVGLAAEATIVHNDAMCLGQLGADRLVAREHPLQAPWRQDQRRPAASLLIINLGTVDLRYRHVSPSWQASTDAESSPLPIERRGPLGLAVSASLRRILNTGHPCLFLPWVIRRAPRETTR